MKKRKQKQSKIADAAASLQRVEIQIKMHYPNGGNDVIYRTLREQRIILREKLYQLIIAN